MTIQDLKKDNLCTYFILPLLRLNKFSFAGSNFVESYLTKDGVCIVVKAYDASLISRKVFTHPGYVGMTSKDEFVYVILTIPKARRIDVRFFMRGKYSRMSDSSKELIYILSTLDYKLSRWEGNYLRQITDGRLLALTRHAALREMYERELDVELMPSDELLEPPGDISYISLDDFTEIKKPQRT